jgi:Spy/CpxP family protein refolding chaperone
MNTKSPVLLAVLGLALLSGLAIAATTSTPPPPAAVPAPPGPPDEIRDRIAAKLGLSAEQQKAIEELRVKQRAEMMALLTPEQQQKAGEMRGQFGERLPRFAQGRRAGGGDEHRGPAMRPGAPANPLAVVAMGERIKDRIAEKLQLTDEQRDKLEHLGRAFRAAQRDAVKKHLEEMRAVLTPEQQQKFEEMKQQHSRRGPQGGHPPTFGMNDDPDDETAFTPPPLPDEES